MSLRRKETTNASYHGIPAGDGVDGSIQLSEPEDAHAKEKDRSTRRRFVTFLLALLAVIIGHSVLKGAGKKKPTPEAAAPAAKAKNIDEGLDALGNARSGPRRVFCYGNSLTSATSSKGIHRMYLEKELNTLYDANPESASADSESPNRTQATIVHHLGLPGWTASQMLDQLNDEKVGVCSIAHRFPTLDLMVILAGTEDVGNMTSVESTSYRDIVKSIIDLHKGAINCAVEEEGNERFHTLVVGIPERKHQELTSHVNSALEVFASEFSGRVSYFNFPFHYEEGDPKWNADGLHLTQEGYEALARELAPHVKNILDNIGSE